MRVVLLALVVILAETSLSELLLAGTVLGPVLVFAGLLVKQNVVQGTYWSRIVDRETARANTERDSANTERDRADRSEVELARLRILHTAAEAKSVMLELTNDELRRDLSEARTPLRRPRRTEGD